MKTTISKKLIKVINNNEKSFVVVKIPYKTLTPKGTDISNYSFIVNTDELAYVSGKPEITIHDDKIYHIKRTKAKEGAQPIQPGSYIYAKADLETIDAYILGSDLVQSLENSRKEYEAYLEKAREEFYANCVLV